MWTESYKSISSIQQDQLRPWLIVGDIALNPPLTLGDQLTPLRDGGAENAGLENAGVEKAGADSRGKKNGNKLYVN